MGEVDDHGQDFLRPHDAIVDVTHLCRGEIVGRMEGDGLHQGLLLSQDQVQDQSGNQSDDGPRCGDGQTHLTGAGAGVIALGQAQVQGDALVGVQGPGGLAGDGAAAHLPGDEVAAGRSVGPGVEVHVLTVKGLGHGDGEGCAVDGRGPVGRQDIVIHIVKGGDAVFPGIPHIGDGVGLGAGDRGVGVADLDDGVVAVGGGGEIVAGDLDIRNDGLVWGLGSLAVDLPVKVALEGDVPVQAVTGLGEIHLDGFRDGVTVVFIYFHVHFVRGGGKAALVSQNSAGQQDEKQGHRTEHGENLAFHGYSFPTRDGILTWKNNPVPGRCRVINTDK